MDYFFVEEYDDPQDAPEMESCGVFMGALRAKILEKSKTQPVDAFCEFIDLAFNNPKFTVRYLYFKN